MNETTKISINADKYISVQLEIPTVMNATEFEGFLVKLNTVKSLTRKGSFIGEAKKTMLRWTPEMISKLKAMSKLSAPEAAEKMNVPGLTAAHVHYKRSTF